MRANVRRTVQLGEVVVAAFDMAAQHSTDSREISRLATKAVVQMLRRAWETSLLPSAPAAITTSS
jgi:hypothetical protein